MSCFICISYVPVFQIFHSERSHLCLKRSFPVRALCAHSLPDRGRGPACMWAQDHLRGVLSCEIFMLVDGVAKTLSISLYTYDAMSRNI